MVFFVGMGCEWGGMEERQPRHDNRPHNTASPQKAFSPGEALVRCDGWAQKKPSPRRMVFVIALR